MEIVFTYDTNTEKLLVKLRKRKRFEKERLDKTIALVSPERDVPADGGAMRLADHVRAGGKVLDDEALKLLVFLSTRRQLVLRGWRGCVRCALHRGNR